MQTLLLLEIVKHLLHYISNQHNRFQLQTKRDATTEKRQRNTGLHRPAIIQCIPHEAKAVLSARRGLMARPSDRCQQTRPRMTAFRQGGARHSRLVEIKRKRNSIARRSNGARCRRASARHGDDICYAGFLFRILSAFVTAIYASQTDQRRLTLK